MRPGHLFVAALNGSIYPAADPPGEPAEQKAAEDIQGIVDVLNQQQEGDAKSYHQGGPLIAPAGKAEI